MQSGNASGAVGGRKARTAEGSHGNKEVAFGVRSIFVLRHGSRPDSLVDPVLDARGRREAEQVAAYFGRQLSGGGTNALGRIATIFCSPFRRALETAVPIATALNLPIRVEWGFCELLAHRWLHHRDPLPGLRSRLPELLPGHRIIDWSYKSAVDPVYPDVEGRMTPGNAQQRQKALDRHRRAIEAALAATPDDASVLVVGHGATHDFVSAAVCPIQHLRQHQSGSGYVAPHCSITQICWNPQKGSWNLQTFGSTPWKQQPLCKTDCPQEPLDSQLVPAAKAEHTDAPQADSAHEPLVSQLAQAVKADRADSPEARSIDIQAETAQNM